MSRSTCKRHLQIILDQSIVGNNEIRLLPLKITGYTVRKSVFSYEYLLQFGVIGPRWSIITRKRLTLPLSSPKLMPITFVINYWSILRNIGNTRPSLRLYFDAIHATKICDSLSILRSWEYKLSPDRRVVCNVIDKSNKCQ